MDNSSVLIGTHAVSMECPCLDVPITAYAGTFGNPWGPRTVTQPVTAQAAQMGKLEIKESKHFSLRICMLVFLDKIVK